MTPKDNRDPGPPGECPGGTTEGKLSANHKERDCRKREETRGGVERKSGGRREERVDRTRRRVKKANGKKKTTAKTGEDRCIGKVNPPPSDQRSWGQSRRGQGEKHNAERSPENRHAPVGTWLHQVWSRLRDTFSLFVKKAGSGEEVGKPGGDHRLQGVWHRES
ncbi:hypothetical protein NDU88_000678 [Pleurodeles waltl]|uniref:Uncharacterized protein n=1 Tax=Pleurodeles waltl TaxID=8319 RepID=A0AAV7TFI4_PLEWA|nr:hypothetical protein NDU88_000678 [Pleurodeles waltl]